MSITFKGTRYLVLFYNLEKIVTKKLLERRKILINSESIKKGKNKITTCLYQFSQKNSLFESDNSLGKNLKEQFSQLFDKALEYYFREELVSFNNTSRILSQPTASLLNNKLKKNPPEDIFSLRSFEEKTKLEVVKNPTLNTYGFIAGETLGKYFKQLIQFSNRVVFLNLDTLELQLTPKYNKTLALFNLFNILSQKEVKNVKVNCKFVYKDEKFSLSVSNKEEVITTFLEQFQSYLQNFFGNKLKKNILDVNTYIYNAGGNYFIEGGGRSIGFFPDDDETLDKIQTNGSKVLETALLMNSMMKSQESIAYQSFPDEYKKIVEEQFKSNHLFEEFVSGKYHEEVLSELIDFPQKELENFYQIISKLWFIHYPDKKEDLINFTIKFQNKLIKKQKPLVVLYDIFVNKKDATFTKVSTKENINVARQDFSEIVNKGNFLPEIITEDQEFLKQLSEREVKLTFGWVVDVLLKDEQRVQYRIHNSHFIVPFNLKRFRIFASLKERYQEQIVRLLKLKCKQTIDSDIYFEFDVEIESYKEDYINSFLNKESVYTNYLWKRLENATNNCGLHINLPYTLSTTKKDKTSETITVFREVVNWSHSKVHYVAGTNLINELQTYIESSAFKKNHNLPF